MLYGERNEKKRRTSSDLVLIPVAFVSLLVIDVGLTISLSLAAYWGLRFLAGNLTFRQLVKKGLVYGSGLLMAYLFFTVLSVILGGSFINPWLVVHTLVAYGSKGFSTLPIDFHTFFWVYVLSMVAGFSLYALNQKETAWQRAVLLSTTLFTFASVYFVNRSHPHNLFNLASVWLMQLFILLTPLLQKIERLSNRKRNFAYALGLGLLVLVPAFGRQDNLTHIFREKVGRLPIAQRLPARLRTNFSIDFERDLRSLSQMYTAEIQLIQATFPDQDRPIVIFALDDTYLYYFSHRTNLLWSNPLNTIIQAEDVTRALRPLKSSGCPEMIAYDYSCLQKSTCARSPEYGYYVAQGQAYEAFSKICGRYEPI